jgi:hypothetical protein
MNVVDDVHEAGLRERYRRRRRDQEARQQNALQHVFS